MDDKNEANGGRILALVVLLMCLGLIAFGLFITQENVSGLLSGLEAQALEVRFTKTILFLTFGILGLGGLAILAFARLFKIALSESATQIIHYSFVFTVVGGLAFRILGSYAIDYYVENEGYVHCEHRSEYTMRRTETSWVRYALSCGSDMALTGLTEAKLQRFLEEKGDPDELRQELGLIPYE